MFSRTNFKMFFDSVGVYKFQLKNRINSDKNVLILLIGLALTLLDLQPRSDKYSKNTTIGEPIIKQKQP